MIPLLAASCGSLLLDIVNMALPEEIRALEAVSLILDTADCILSVIDIKESIVESMVDLPGLACVNAVTTFARYVLAWASETEENLQDSEALAGAALEYGTVLQGHPRCDDVAAHPAGLGHHHFFAAAEITGDLAVDIDDLGAYIRRHLA